jgi:hypothetical protein
MSFHIRLDSHCKLRDIDTSGEKADSLSLLSRERTYSANVRTTENELERD